jgi:acetyl esterase
MTGERLRMLYNINRFFGAVHDIAHERRSERMPLDPQVQALLEEMAAFETPPLSNTSVEDARNQIVQGIALWRGEPTPIKQVEDREIPGPQGNIPVRIYTPEGAGPFPVLVYFHGGGWVICNLDTHDDSCRKLANLAGCIVVSVDYRLAPEHKFPAAAEDCYAATRWAAENAASFNGDPARLAIGGDSAGGNLAAVVALMARDRGGPPLVFQLLIYPVTDYYTPGTPSYQENAEGYFLTRDDMIWFWNHYLNDESEAKHPYASPLQAPDLSNLPPALVITAEFDPLRDEGEKYAERLREAGVPVVLKRYDGMIHGFFGMGARVDKSIQANAEAAEALRSAFAQYT